MPRIQINSIQNMKAAGEKITMLTAYDYFTAQMIDESGVDMILVGDTLAMAFGGKQDTLSVRMKHMTYHCEIVSRATKRSLIVGDMPFLSYQKSTNNAVKNAGRLMQEGGVQAVKLEGGRTMIPVIRKILRAGIPVMGHIGLTPQSIHILGGFRVQGKDEESAKRLKDAALALQDAGCFALVLEAVPATLAEEISKQLSIPTIGIGAGMGVDGQVLVTPDMLGITGFQARYIKQYENLKEHMSLAFKNYISDVKEKRFPEPKHQYQ